MEKDHSITKYFGANLAKLLSEKILAVYNNFDHKGYVLSIKRQCTDMTYTQRIDLHATELKKKLPADYEKAITILVRILGDENKHETGMFTNFYWVMPIGKFIEKYGLEHYSPSIKAIEEVTKRNTGEYAIRPFLRRFPKRTIKIMKKWAQSDNFHLRRLASEGLRPKLPWSKKLDEFIEKPKAVFEILDLLKEDEVKFVKKSVANHLTDYSKSEPKANNQTIERMGKIRQQKHSVDHKACNQED